MGLVRDAVARLLRLLNLDKYLDLNSFKLGATYDPKRYTRAHA